MGSGAFSASWKEICLPNVGTFKTDWIIALHTAGIAGPAGMQTEVAAKIDNCDVITLNRNNTAWGTVTGAGTYADNASVTVTATPTTGYRFVNWTEDGTAVSTSASYTFTKTRARVLVANFEAITYALTLNRNITAGGTVSASATSPHNHGTSVTATATAATGYRFVNWTEGSTVVSTDAAYTFTITSARTLVANFVATYTLALSSNDDAWGTVSGVDTYDDASSVTAIAKAKRGYLFVNWTEDDEEVSTDASYTFTMTGNRTLVANFVVRPERKAGDIRIGGEIRTGKNATITIGSP